jgi:predicted negative regulator of RcsB-dependent stress response
MSDGSSQQPSSGIQPPNQDIYGQGERPEPVRRRRRRWFSPEARPGGQRQSDGGDQRGRGAAGGNAGRMEEHRRRRRRHGHSPELDLINRVTWIAVTVVTLLYLGLLAAVVLWQRTHPKVQKIEVAPVAPAENVAAVQPTNMAPLQPVSESIAHWKSALQTLEAIHKVKTKQHPSEVAALLEKALAETPNFTQARLELALALMEQKNHTAARDHLLEVLNHDPASLPGQEALGRVFLALNQPDEALALARWMVDNDPYSTPAHELAAEALLKQNVTADAIVHLKKLTSLNRDNLALQNNLARPTSRWAITVPPCRPSARCCAWTKVTPSRTSISRWPMPSSSRPAISVEVLTQAARRFGHPFVATWTRGAEFDAVRDDPVFVQFLGHPEALTNAPAVPNTP